MILSSSRNADDEKRRTLELRQQAAALIPSVVAKQADMLRTLTEAHEDDVSTYNFECKRHGDWLAIFMTRGRPITEQDEYDWRQHKVSYAINLAACRAISVIAGRGPDLKGRVGFHLSYSGGADYDVSELTDGVAYYPRYQMINIAAPSVDKSGHITHGVSWGGGRDVFSGIHVPDCARSAQDDKIEFAGAGVTLFAPFGIGDHVRDLILEELSRGAPMSNVDALTK